MKNWSKILRNFSLMSQLGLSLTVPLLLCLFLCSWLVNRFAVGAWVYLPGFILGMGSSAVTAWKLYRSAVGSERKEGRGRSSFNRHS